MWFLPRLTPLLALATLAGLIAAFVLHANVVYLLSGAIFGVLLMAVLFELYEGRRR